MYKFLIPLFALALLVGCTSTPDSQVDGYSTSSISSAKPKTSSSSSPAMSSSAASADTTLMKGTHEITLKTSEGDIVISVDADRAPMAATNFYMLSKTGYYNGLTFHRTIPGFMIQGGDPAGNGSGGESIFGPTFKNEPNDWKIVRGKVAMANRGPDTNGSQFFIVHAEETPWLDGGYTVFGEVKKGMDVVDKIANVPVVSRSPSDPQADRPVTPVTFDAVVAK